MTFLDEVDPAIIHEILRDDLAFEAIEENRIPNPHLPPAPADGKHQIKGRCNFCGAYGGSPEAEKPCQGEWKESAKMRSHASGLLLADLLLVGGSPRRVLKLRVEEFASIVDEDRTGVSFGSGREYALLLDCGHWRDVGYQVHEKLRWSAPPKVACIEKHCPRTSADKNRVLNGMEPVAR